MGYKEDRACLVCGKIFTVYKRAIGRRRNQFCSLTCMGKAKTLGLIKRKTKGMIIKICVFCGKQFEIHNWKTNIQNRKYCSVPCARADRKGKPLGVKRLRNNQTELAKAKINQKCAICGFKRYIEIAHIIPASYGGKPEMGNILFLCPNHHRLFDIHKLRDNEIAKLTEFAKDIYFAIKVRRNPNNIINKM